jgi:branched-chain amino acid transport system substrate-binding protein
MQIRGWRRSIALASTLVVVLGIGGTAAQARPTASASTQATSTIKVGIIYSRTGLLSAYGAQYVQGLRLGLEYATKGTNTVAGKKIELTLVDDATDPAKAVTAAKDLIGQGYKIIGGSTSSGAALAVAPLAAQNQVLFISGPAANDLITGANRYTFRSGRQTQQDVLTAKEILGKGVGKRITVFAQDSAFGAGNVTAVRTLIGGKGHTVSSILVPLSAQDFTPFAQQAKQARPDLLFVAWAGTTANAMWTAMQQQGVMNDVTVSTGLAERATWGAYPPGINFLSHYVAEAPKNKVNDWLVAKMKRRNQKPDLFTPDGFNAALMIVRAIQKGGGENVDSMISALEGYQFVGPKGVNRIRQQDHALLQPMFSAKVRQVNGKWQAFQTKVYSPGNLQPPIRPFPTN